MVPTMRSRSSSPLFMGPRLVFGVVEVSAHHHCSSRLGARMPSVVSSSSSLDGRGLDEGAYDSSDGREEPKERGRQIDRFDGRCFCCCCAFAGVVSSDSRSAMRVPRGEKRGSGDDDEGAAAVVVVGSSGGAG